MTLLSQLIRGLGEGGRKPQRHRDTEKQEDQSTTTDGIWVGPQTQLISRFVIYMHSLYESKRDFWFCCFGSHGQQLLLTVGFSPHCTVAPATGTASIPTSHPHRWRFICVYLRSLLFVCVSVTLWLFPGAGSS